MVYTGEEMEKIARIIEKHEGLFIISDEIYEHIMFEGRTCQLASFDFIYDRVITVNGCFKRICNDRMEDWLYRCSSLDGKSLQ